MNLIMVLAKFLRTMALLLPALLFAHEAAAARAPNIVLILADDLGWADLGCYGSRFHQTPNIDRLASQGMRFTDAYAAAPICSAGFALLVPSR